jgi:hypothetical protein
MLLAFALAFIKQPRLAPENLGFQYAEATKQV